MSSNLNFIIVATQRTGSNYLQSLLGSHPDIYCAGEILVQPDLLSQQLDTSSVPQREREQLLNLIHKRKGCSAIKTFFDLERHLNEKSLGFRLFYNHLGFLQRQLTFAYMRRQDIKIIHLTRKNLFERYVSLQLAQQTQRWVAHDEVKQNTIHIESDDCLSYLQTAQKEIDFFSKRLPHARTLNVSYEDLTSVPDMWNSRILEHIGVAEAPLSSDLKKINRAPPEEVIVNYEEVRKVLLGTRWQQFLS